MKSLLIEDDTPTAAVLSEGITAQHYTVDMAADAEMDLQLATDWKYDLIWLDLLISRWDGINPKTELQLVVLGLVTGVIGRTDRAHLRQELATIKRRIGV